jgi:hypothetical protein
MKGGSAVDSAIASALCIGVVNSFATGMQRKDIKKKKKKKKKKKEY